ncbi:MAG: AAA family ATPase [Saprospiraceae bacterium]|jgi:predicted ATP-binding protein involved in virulence|nr:AAA family ATPase [Saprospiraceae bacterium]
MKSITLNNFRCFEKINLDFSDKVNLLVGDNASGKTTIIRALSAALGSFFTGFSDDNTRFAGLNKEDFRVVSAENGLANEKPVCVEFQWLEKTGKLVLNSPKGRTLTGPLRELKLMGAELYKNLFLDGKQVKALPLITSFLTADIHKPRRIGSHLFKKYEHKPSFGYFECFQGDGFMKYWTLRLLALREARTGETEISGVINALKSALGPEGCNIVADIDIRPIQRKVYYHLTDGRSVDSDNLSDGYRRLVSIVMDISFRCMLLNKGMYGINACAMTEGTVLIDEIDLHLHPALQSSVMKGLQRGFPGVQFIITSHAPMIMTGIISNGNNRIIKLGYSSEEGYSARNIDAYGLDASTIIQAVLGVTPRSQEVEDQLATLFGLIDDDEYERAAQKLEQMRDEFSDNLPELSRAGAMLDFLK